MAGPQFYKSIADLPRTIAVFPLPGAILFPRAPLPLNIFEPRYLSMFDDALKSTRLIGMIQPMNGDETLPRLYPVGCAGRIAQFAETQDGRYLVTLGGVARFRAVRELDVTTPYRQLQVDFTPFADDVMQESGAPVLDRKRLCAALTAYLKDKRLAADIQGIENAPVEAVVNTLAMICPFSVSEKQALVEAPDLNKRGETLLALLEMGGASGNGAKSVQ